MEARAKHLTRILQDYDRELIAVFRYGRIDIMRKCFRMVAYDVDGCTLLAPVRNDWYVMSLTHDWHKEGRPVDWGVEPLLHKLTSIDLHRRDLAEESIKAYEKNSEAKDRALDNNLEAFWKDNRRAWAKNFEQVNRSNVTQTDRRYRDEKNKKMKGL
jgi:hypothetical protein